VRRASRCAEGRVLVAGTPALPAAEGLSPVKARIALLLELMP
jgi:L-asparaginase